MNKNLYNFILAFFVFAIIRYTLSKKFSGNSTNTKEMIVMSFFYSLAYIILKNYAK